MKRCSIRRPIVAIEFDFCCLLRPIFCVKNVRCFVLKTSDVLCIKRPRKRPMFCVKNVLENVRCFV